MSQAPDGADGRAVDLSRQTIRLDDLRAAWAMIAERWRATEARAARLGTDACEERVGGEWSFAETLRHLVFVTDAWVGRVVLGLPAPYHPAALPPTFLPDMADVGIDARRDWPFDDVLAARRDRQARVEHLLAGLTDEELGRTCDAQTTPGFPPDTAVPVLRCVQTVLGEEWAHHEYATRDLAVLEART